MKLFWHLLLLIFFATGCIEAHQKELDSGDDSIQKDPRILGDYCQDPAFLGEKPLGWNNHGFIGYLKDGFDLNIELVRFENAYNFEASHIYDMFNGFAGPIPETHIESMRCEKSVDSIFYSDGGSSGGSISF